MITKTNNLVSVLPFLVFFVFYSVLLSQNLSITHDSINYLLQVNSGKFIYHLHHLIYQPFLVVIVSALSFLGLEIDIQIAIGMVSALAGALSLQAVYLIMKNRLQLDTYVIWLGLFACGFSFGIWYYSETIEIYTLPLCCLAWTFYFLLNENPGYKTVLIAAILHSIAILFHQTAIFFAFVPVFALLSLRVATLSKRFVFLGTYVLTGTIIVSSAYFLAAVGNDAVNSVSDFIEWFVGSANSEKYVRALSPSSILLAAVGFGRAIIGAHFIFGIPELRELLLNIFSGNSLQDEIFFVQNLTLPVIYTLCAISILTIIVILFLTTIAIRNLVKGKYHSPKRSILLLITWLLPYTLFFIIWDPTNVDLWIPQVVVFWVLLAALCVNRVEHKRKYAYLLLCCVFGLFIVNGVGSVLPAKNKSLDYYRVHVNMLKQEIDAGDHLYIGDSWPITEHLKYHSEIDFTAITKVYQDTSIEDLVMDMRNRLAADQKVYLSSDVLASNYSTQQYYGVAYIEYLNKLHSHICGTNRAVPEKAGGLVELKCVE